LQASYDELTKDFSAAQDSIKELTAVNESLNCSFEELKVKNSELEATVAAYEAQRIAAEENRKIALVEKYEKIISDAEEIEIIKG
jgi:allophanate hydrolase subunit 1